MSSLVEEDYVAQVSPCEEGEQSAASERCLSRTKKEAGLTSLVKEELLVEGRALHSLGRDVCNHLCALSHPLRLLQKLHVVLQRASEQD
eukprot:1067972-Rhodomonas_salina.2